MPYTHASGRSCVIGGFGRVRSATLWVAILLGASMSPLLLGNVSASTAIGLSADVVHVQLSPGDSTNVTLTIENNGSSIEDYNVSVDSSSIAASWSVIAAQELVEDVLPTFSQDTTIVVRLAVGAAISDSGSVVIHVNETDGSESSSITIHLSVMPDYGARIDTTGVGDEGLVSMAPGSTLDIVMPIVNEGNVIDSIVLDVEEDPDLAQWWSDWNLARQPQPSVTERLSLSSPVNGSKHNTSSGNLSISLGLMHLTPSVAYGLSLEVYHPNNGSLIWSDNHVVNQSNTSMNFSQ